MAWTKVRLGELLELVTETNDALQYKADDVRGMTITKEIIPTRANVNNTDLRKFLVVHPREFVFNPRTHGKKIGFGYNDTEDVFLISWNNIAFRVSEVGKKLVLPEYLFLHFNRSEWDREACFRSWGSSTEVFSWDALCEMEIELPEPAVQERFVAVYRAMAENRAAYERGLSDLKLACDAAVEHLKKKYPAVPIGQFLIPSEARNTEKLSADFVRGLSASKEMIETKANMDGVSVDNYKIVPPGSIAYVADTSRRGDKISLAQNRSGETFLVSSISTVFDTDRDHLLPEFLMLFFGRDEFDRYARFHSWGSARETFDWDEMCDVKIPIPEISIQRAIVNVCEAYLLRKEIAERLGEQMRALCPILIKGSLEEGKQ